MRPATSDDIDAVHQIECESFGTPWSKDSFLAELDKSYSLFYVLELENEVAGYIVVWKLFDEAEVANIAVKSSFRGRGLGRQILSFAFEQYADVSSWFLEVHSTNSPAVSLYESFGFAVYGVSRGYYGPGEDALLMRCDLTKG